MNEDLDLLRFMLLQLPERKFVASSGYSFTLEDDDETITFRDADDKKIAYEDIKEYIRMGLNRK
jgi:hypothetical protein